MGEGQTDWLKPSFEKRLFDLNLEKLLELSRNRYREVELPMQKNHLSTKVRM